MENEKIDLTRVGLREYAEAVALMAKNGSEKIFLNSGNPHALIVFQNLFKYSDKKIRLLAGNLKNPVTASPEYQDALISFLRKGDTQLEILLDNYKDGKKSKESALFRVLYPYHDRITIKHTIGDLKMRMKDSDGNRIAIHMCIGDEKMYRVETDTRLRKAECCLNGSKYAKMLTHAFDTFFNSNYTNTVDIIDLAFPKETEEVC